MNNIDLIALIDTEEGAEALSALCAQARTNTGRDEIDHYLPESVITSAVNDPSPKKRKNAYRLIGLLKNNKYLPLLQSALANETTLFTVPSLLLSLGALHDANTISNYSPPVSENEAMNKHVAEIVMARKKALQSLNKHENKAVCALDGERELLCFAPEGFNDFLAEELCELGFDTEVAHEYCKIVTADLTRLFKAKLLVEALIPIAADVRLDADSIRKKLVVMPEEPYRIELRGYTKDRRKLIHALSSVLEGENNPSSYVWELRIDCRGETADLYWKPFHTEDNRYPWRKRVLPASMHPTLAAGLAAYVKNLVTVQNPSVLDPFCGTGSLLFSLESVINCRSLMGVDKSSTAIQYARENAIAGKSKAHFVTKDILRFRSASGFDLIISNMPFGLRVGNHDYNKDLYRGFLNRLPGLLTDGGVAVLYTMEYKLLQSCLKETPGLKVREKMRTQAGGLLPWIFVIDKA